MLIRDVNKAVGYKAKVKAKVTGLETKSKVKATSKGSGAWRNECRK